MSFTKESAVEAAKKDLAKRLKIDTESIKGAGISNEDFPDMSLGSPENGEMSAQMISSGWRIRLKAGDKQYEYRADKYQLRLHNFNGKNIVIVS
jgi:hypothetical protein